ncbi:MAG: hypothetical protein AB7P00_37425 [Sandaracinaceae bacterium]
MLVVLLAGATGLAALAGEVLWTRVLRTVLHATTQAFSGMLLTYLFGIALGALLARRLTRDRSRAALVLGTTQLLMAVLVVLAMLAVPQLVRLIPLLRGDLSFVPTQPATILAICTMLLLPLAAVSGAGLPLVFQLVEADEADAARGTGRLLAANTLGGGLGSILAGFVMVPALGVEASLLVVMFVHLAVAGAALRRAALTRGEVIRALALTAPLAVGVGAVLLAPSVNLPFLMRTQQDPVRAIVEGPSARWRDGIVFFREGRASTVTVARTASGLGLSNDGRPESGFGQRDPGFGAELATLGSMPVLFGQRTERAMVIGLGAGHTTSVLLRGGFERVDVIELEQAVIDAARFMHDARHVPFPLDDPRAHVVVDDARNRLVLAEPDSYDAIVSQPSHPWLAGSSALYTRQFFEEADSALREGGVLAIWVNLFRIRMPQIRAVLNTLSSVFPHVQGFIVEGSSLILCASKHPPAWDAQLAERIERLRDAYLAAFDLGTPDKLLRAMELDPDAVRHLAAGAASIEDDRPLLEFELAATPESVHVRLADFDRALAETPWWSAAFAGRVDRRAEALAARIDASLARPLALDRVASAIPQAQLAPSDEAYVRGALAEARGDVTAALAAWDASERAEAATRADRLRLLEGMPHNALRVAGTRSARPDRADSLLLAALEIDSPAALREAVALAERVSAPSDASLLRYVEAEANRPCSADPRLVAALSDLHGAVAFRAQRCAFLAGDTRLAERLGTLAVRGPRVAAEASWELGEACLAGGNGGCALLMLRRAIRQYPSHSRAAVSLARMLHARGDDAAARTTLLDALAETRGIAASQQRIAAAAAELELDLGVELPAADGASPTSTAPTVTPTRRPDE